jgi:hypothetical protein
MAALVDYTALEGLGDTGAAATKAIKTSFPIAGPPAKSIGHDGWVKIRLDFSKTNLTDGDWAKFFVIPAHTFVMEVMTNIITAEGGASGVTIGDTNADHSTEWLATQAASSANVVNRTLVAATNGATRGKYYHTAGALYISATATLDTLVIDVYVHLMKMEEA